MPNLLTPAPVSLALQGGATLGAYTWGFLDALLEDGRLDIDGVTGTSAGAINAVALAVGWTAGGRAGARESLRAVWEGLAYPPTARRWPRFWHLRWALKHHGRLASAAAFYELTARHAADLLMDPVTMNPVRSTLDATLDYSVLARPDAMRVFVNATDIRTLEPRVFSGAEITTDAVCASSAVPLMFHPVTIDGQDYWDGALLGNPLIYPVIYQCRAPDVVLVETRSEGTMGRPRSAVDVVTRAIQVSSAAGLLRELRAIDLVSELLDEAPHPTRRRIRFHRVSASPALAALDHGRGFKAGLDYFHRLRDLGRLRAQEWLGSEVARGIVAGAAA